MREEWTIKIVDVGYRFTRDVFIFRRTLGGTEFIQGDGAGLFVAEGEAIPPKPAIQLDPEALQALADELARTGYKPQKGFVEGKLNATEKHLEDMRKLVFTTTQKEIEGTPTQA